MYIINGRGTILQLQSSASFTEGMTPMFTLSSDTCMLIQVRCKYFFRLNHLYLFRNQKARGKLDTSGFQTIQANSISVTFHVLLPYEIWGWNEKTKLVMFFGEQILGNWRAGIGDFIARYACICYEVNVMILTVSQGSWSWDV